jgi:hypothetical protein
MSRTDEKYLRLLKERYRKASRKERTAMLDEFVKTTGYHRKYAISLLNGRQQRAQGPIKRPRRAIYGPEEARALVILSQLFDHINSKRLRKALDAELQGLYESGFLQVSSECYQKLKRVNPATMDRLLAGRRRRPGKRQGLLQGLRGQVGVVSFEIDEAQVEVGHPQRGASRERLAQRRSFRLFQAALLAQH